MDNNTTAPGASMYEKADEYLESVLIALDKSDDPANFETLKTVVYLAKLNRLFHQIETSPNHGKAEAIGRLLDTDFLNIHIYVTGENTLELEMFDAIRCRNVLKIEFADLGFLCQQKGSDPLTKGQSYYIKTGQSFLPEEGQKAEKSGKEPPDKQTAPKILFNTTLGVKIGKACYSNEKLLEHIGENVIVWQTGNDVFAWASSGVILGKLTRHLE